VPVALASVAGVTFGAVLAALARRVRSGDPQPPPWVGPLVALGSGALFAGSIVDFRKDPFVGWFIGPFLAVLLVLGLIDLRRRLIPNAILYPAFGAAVLAVGIGAATGRHVDLARAAAGMALLGGVLLFAYLIRPSQMGFGDVKLAGLIGLGLGSQGLRYVAVAGVLGLLAGGLGGAALLLLGRARRSAFSYGPFLVAGAIAAAFGAPEIAQAYLSRFA